MKIKDPIDWREPEAISSWGSEFSPPLEDPWAHYIFSLRFTRISPQWSGDCCFRHSLSMREGSFLKEKFSIEVYSDCKAKLGSLAEIEQNMNLQTHL